MTTAVGFIIHMLNDVAGTAGRGSVYSLLPLLKHDGLTAMFTDGDTIGTQDDEHDSLLAELPTRG